MPNHDPHRPGPGQPSDPRRSSVDAGVYEERECRSCGSTITAPYPNQFECDSCETLKSKLDVKSPSADEIGTQEESLQDDPTIPSELERDVIIAELPEIETQPKSRRKILRCIDGSGNEDKFRALHIEGDWGTILRRVERRRSVSGCHQRVSLDSCVLLEAERRRYGRFLSVLGTLRFGPLERVGPTRAA